MGLFPAVVTFLIIWWTVLFAVLPIGVRGQAEVGEVVRGSEPGAPVEAQLWKKLKLTTMVSAGLFAVIFIVISLGIVDVGAAGWGG